jgi:hypothetical protein
MFMILDKLLILNKIKEHYSFKKDSDFARFLEIKPQTLASWYTRNTFDIELLYSKCIGIDGNFLLSGEGDMMKNSNIVIEKTAEAQNTIDELTDKTDLIKFQRKKIEDLEEEISKLKIENETSERHLYVAEPRSELKSESKK